LEREEASIDSDEAKLKLATLMQLQPNTDEMRNIYETVISAIDNQQDNDKVKFFSIDAMGGSGKTTLATKIYHYVHAKQKIVLGAAATGLACEVYKDLNFETFHSLFSVPVFETEDDYDSIYDIPCQISKNPQKFALVNEAKVIIMDEVFSNHKYCFTSVFKSYNNLQGVIVYTYSYVIFLP
jgi:signal recognition particle GTPase